MNRGRNRDRSRNKSKDSKSKRSRVQKRTQATPRKNLASDSVESADNKASSNSVQTKKPARKQYRSPQAKAIRNARSNAKSREKTKAKRIKQMKRPKGSDAKTSAYMSDGITKRHEFYGNRYIREGATLEEMSIGENPHQTDAPTLKLLKHWRRHYKWKQQRTLYLEQADAVGAQAPRAVTDLEGQIEQMKRAYNPLGAESIEPVKHYSDNLSDKLRPFYLASLSDPSLLSLERDIAVCNMFLAEYADQLSNGGSAENWATAKAAFQEVIETGKAVNENEPGAMPKYTRALKALSKAFNQPNTDHAYRQIAFWQDQKRRSIAVETNRIEKAEQYININQAMGLNAKKWAAVMQVIRRYDDPALSLKICEALDIDV